MSTKTDFTFSEADQNDIEYLVCHVGLLWRRLINDRVKALGLSGTEKRILCCVNRHPGITQIQLAKLLDLEPQNLTRVLDRLDQQKLIQKRADCSDRRVRCLHVTAAAKKLIQRIVALSNEVKPNVLAGIPEKNLQTAVRQLNAIRANLLAHLQETE
ncbi:MAG: MarR family transcriptional regulator [Gammaproteobacteria bacterium]|nr:MarR family transcriptional regulator [Gammaproteobacteria bacterium]